MTPYIPCYRDSRAKAGYHIQIQFPDRLSKRLSKGEFATWVRYLVGERGYKVGIQYDAEHQTYMAHASFGMDSEGA